MNILTSKPKYMIATETSNNGHNKPARIRKEEIEQFMVFVKHIDQEKVTQLEKLLFGAMIPGFIHSGTADHSNVFACSVLTMIELWRNDRIFEDFPHGTKIDSGVLDDNIYFYNANRKRRTEIELAITTLIAVFIKNNNL